MEILRGFTEWLKHGDQPPKLFLVSDGKLMPQRIFDRIYMNRTLLEGSTFPRVTEGLGKFLHRNQQFVAALREAHQQFPEDITVAVIAGDHEDPSVVIAMWKSGEIEHVAGYPVGEISCSRKARNSIATLPYCYGIFHTDRNLPKLRKKVERADRRVKQKLQTLIAQQQVPGFDEVAVKRMMEDAANIVVYNPEKMSAINYLALVATEELSGETVVQLTLPDPQEGNAGRRGNHSE